MLLRLALTGLLALLLLACGDSATEEGWEEPTQGLITTVTEVQEDEYKIASEETVPSPADSRIIVNNLEGTSDTFTLDEAKLIEAEGSSASRPIRSAMLGYWGFMMLGRMGGSPGASAYVNQQAYNNANQRAGQPLRTSARARGGFGSGAKSTRSYGG